jgi:hypothetical protein
MLASRPAKLASGRDGLPIDGRRGPEPQLGEGTSYLAIARSTASASSGERARLGRPRSSSLTYTRA